MNSSSSSFAAGGPGASADDGKIAALEAERTFVKRLLCEEQNTRTNMCDESEFRWLRAYKADDELKYRENSLTQEIHDLRTTASGKHSQIHPPVYFSLFHLFQ